MKRHIEAERGILAFCPEGGMNKAPQDGLKPFRRGSFARSRIARRSGRRPPRLHGRVAARRKMGGYPCTVGVSLKLLTTPAAGATPADPADSSQAAMQLSEPSRRAAPAQGSTRSEQETESVENVKDLRTIACVTRFGARCAPPLHRSL